MTAHVGSASLPPSSFDRSTVRREMRARRRLLSPRDRKHASNRLASLAQRHFLLQPGKRIAAYIAHGAEADPKLLLHRAQRNGCEVYLPKIADYRSNRMRFVRLDPASKLRRNRYGIPEPVGKASAYRSVRCLDLIFVPLVAVDADGNRIGSGAGFYDRALNHLRGRSIWRRPKLVGIAFECQRLAHIPPHSWDVPLDALLTEKSFYRFRPRNAPCKGKL